MRSKRHSFSSAEALLACHGADAGSAALQLALDALSGNDDEAIREALRVTEAVLELQHFRTG